jgi:hypothetical protein
MPIGGKDKVERRNIKGEFAILPGRYLRLMPSRCHQVASHKDERKPFAYLEIFRQGVGHSAFLTFAKEILLRQNESNFCRERRRDFVQKQENRYEDVPKKSLVRATGIDSIAGMCSLPFPQPDRLRATKARATRSTPLWSSEQYDQWITVPIERRC